MQNVSPNLTNIDNNKLVMMRRDATYKWNFSSQVGLSSLGTVFVLFLSRPTCTVTYGSLVPVLSLPINPCALFTKTQHISQQYNKQPIMKQRNSLHDCHTIILKMLTSDRWSRTFTQLVLLCIQPWFSKI